MSYFCTLHGHEFLLHDVPVVAQGGKLADPDNAEGIQDEFCEYFAVYRQQIVG
jgi:hypothetical protein